LGVLQDVFLLQYVCSLERAGVLSKSGIDHLLFYLFYLFCEENILTRQEIKVASSHEIEVAYANPYALTISRRQEQIVHEYEPHRR